MTVMISSCVMRAIHRAAVDANPYEACGLLFGATDRIKRANNVPNVAPDSRTRFEIDPAALFDALRAERSGGERIVGYWHSHPGGDARPSVADAQMAAPDGRLWLIVAEERATLWRAGTDGMHGRFAPVALSIADA